MKDITILGSTGSIGQSTLDVARHFPEKFRIKGLSTNNNVVVLYSQIKEFHPQFVCVNNQRAARDLKARLGRSPKLFVGELGLQQLVEEKGAKTIVMAISGSAALKPLLKAIESSKDIALANKEALVMAGSIIMDEAKKKKVKIIPIDSEQSAIWQCLEGQDKGRIKNIYLTASGGPFREKTRSGLKDISIAQVLRHPKWRMGKKISVDSATLMNKGLEVLEAMFLFKVGLEKIKILIHPQAIIHSMVEFVDGVVLAQLSVTDMRIPIQYAISYPQRLPNTIPGLNFPKLKVLNFEKPDFARFPCLESAYRAAKEGGIAPAVLNAANEACVDSFLKKKIKFMEISGIIKKVLDRHKAKACPGLEDILEADAWARREAARFTNN